MAPGTSTNSPSYTLSYKAYLKLILHAAKYPHAPVNGVLLGSSSSSTKDVLVSDAIPLLHHWTSLSPMMEIGLDLARNHAESIGLHIVGYYQATERIDEDVLSPVGERVASLIRERFEDAFAIVINSAAMDLESPPLVPYLPSRSSSGTPSWARTESFSPPQFNLSDANSVTKARESVRTEGTHKKFGDFDDHLEDVTVDWLRGGEWGETGVEGA